MRWLFFVSHMILCSGANASIPTFYKPEPPQNIRVLLGEFSSVKIEAFDLQFNQFRSVGTQSLTISCSTNEHGEGYVYENRGIKKFSQLDLRSPGGFLSFQSRSYRNFLRVIPKGNKCLVINILDREKYLAGLLNKEMSPSWPIEALKSQAIASRSYALYRMEQNKYKEYDIESTTQDQVYSGASSETEKSNLAVEATKGSILTFKDAKPLKAYFHANCGGITEVPENVWGADAGKFRPVLCPYHSEKRNKISWALTLHSPQIEHALQKVAGILPNRFFRLAKLEAGAPDANQRLNDVVVSDRNGNSFVLPANVFRNAIGNTKIKSTSFEIKQEGNSYRLFGKGFGHGVGMCQIGAKAMAEQGKKHREILHYYYPLAKIVQL